MAFHHQGLFSLKEHSFFLQISEINFWVNEITSADEAKQLQILH